MAARITLEEATKRVYEYYNGTIELLEYSGIKGLSEVKCLICNTKWSGYSKNIINGKGYCPICNPIKRDAEKFSLERVMFYLNESGCSLCDKTPSMFVEKVNIKYPCGHINYSSITRLKQGHTCDQCRINNFYVNRFTQDNLIKIATENNLNFIGFVDGYKTGSSLMSYSCHEGHITTRSVKDFIKFPTCRNCGIIRRALANRGDGSSSWKGGISKIWVAARARLDPWTTQSLKACDYKCQITGRSDVQLDVHHLTSFKIIAKEAMAEFGIYDDCYYSKTYSDYGEEVLFRIVDVNMKHGLGICLKKSIHIFYHKLYGHGNNTPEEFEEFKQRIESGELTLPE
jgi:hypothetical protein